MDSAPPSGRTPFLLVLDADAGVAHSVGEIFRAANHLVTTLHVQTLEAAKKALGHAHADLLLLDPDAPEVGGLESLRKLQEWFPDLPIIAYTSNNESEAAMGALDAGAEAFLVKQHTSPDLLRKLCTKLLERVTAKNTERAMQQSREELERSQRTQALARFVGGVAHDLNNLLTIIIGSSELLAETLPEGLREGENLQTVIKTSERAGVLTSKLLAFGHRPVTATIAVNPNPLINDMLPILRSLLREDMTLEVDLDSGLNPVMLEPTQLDQIVMNLIINARDAMPRGGTARIITRNLPRSGLPTDVTLSSDSERFVRLTVTDSGVGMTPETMSRVLEPFFTTKPLGPGAGLGLPTVQGVAQKTGGDVLIRSTLGEGTSIDVFFPAVSSTEESASKNARPLA